MRPPNIPTLALLVLAGVCGGGGGSSPNAAQDDSISVPIPAPPSAGNDAEAPANEAAPGVPDVPDVAGLSPYRRRAYERGFRDCSAGRYDPSLIRNPTGSAARRRKTGERPPVLRDDAGRRNRYMRGHVRR